MWKNISKLREENVRLILILPSLLAPLSTARNSARQGNLSLTPCFLRAHKSWTFSVGMFADSRNSYFQGGNLPAVLEGATDDSWKKLLFRGTEGADTPVFRLDKDGKNHLLSAGWERGVRRQKRSWKLPFVPYRTVEGGEDWTARSARVSGTGTILQQALHERQTLQATLWFTNVNPNRSKAKTNLPARRKQEYFREPDEQNW